LENILLKTGTFYCLPVVKLTVARLLSVLEWSKMLPGRLSKDSVLSYDYRKHFNK